MDFGCGPMTAGVALAEICSGQNKHYKEKVTYLGIDASQNMVDRAKWINEQHGIFDPKRFEIFRGTTFCSEMTATLPSSTAADLVILCLSYVLANATLQVVHSDRPEWVKNLSHEWDRWAVGLPNLDETRIVYLNPDGNFHNIWNWLARFITNTHNGSFSYTGWEKKIPIEGLRDVQSAQMIGKKKPNRFQ